LSRQESIHARRNESIHGRRNESFSGIKEVASRTAKTQHPEKKFARLTCVMQNIFPEKEHS
jgi:hypothetical protein